MPHVSICVPAYCQVDFLRETLISIEAQDFDDYELIISDDSPNDTVEKLINTFQFPGKLTYYRNSVALGSPENWNEAIRRAKGKYIKILHHDDKLAHSGALRSFVRMLDENPSANFAFCATRIEDVIRNKNHIHRLTAVQLMMISKIPEKLFLGNLIGAPSATIYKNGLGIEYDKNMKWLVDIDFYIRILNRNHTFAYSDEVLIITPTNATHQVTEICKSSANIEISEHIMLFEKIQPTIIDNFDYRHAWFRLFEKYKIFSPKDLLKLNIEASTTKDFLTQFFIDYKNEKLKRIHYRVYDRLPKKLKNIIRSIRITFNLI